MLVEHLDLNLPKNAFVIRVGHTSEGRHQRLLSSDCLYRECNESKYNSTLYHPFRPDQNLFLYLTSKGSCPTRVVILFGQRRHWAFSRVVFDEVYGDSIAASAGPKIAQDLARR